ncbi:ATP-dependent zinc protease [Aliikangiella marina]|uniref:ATP-dependent zinc protease n=1 Tax=Aliikangiella marina TaxID=1712262 RepID=A0A545TJK6_9GAMM|nr:ATP-dependent zinc protease [Aliikangiella marina]TQV77403.1 ATP-dependent zinc protease [Aliikangiella marina]
MNDKMIVGALEFCSLPDLEISNLHMRVDTGAKTSALHVDNIEEFEKDGARWVRFDIHPDYHDVDRVVRREAKVKSKRRIKMANDKSETRYVIDTKFVLKDQEWPIELNLTDRSNMTYLMLLGREAMIGRLLVDPEKEYVLTS